MAETLSELAARLEADCADTIARSTLPWVAGHPGSPHTVLRLAAGLREALALLANPPTMYHETAAHEDGDVISAPDVDCEACRWEARRAALLREVAP